MKNSVYIITLASARLRREFQQEQADRLHFSPIWHQAMGIDDFDDATHLAHAFSWQRPLKKTEVGCFLSHLKLWQKIAGSSEPAVVLEDDVILSENWGMAIDVLSKLEGVDCINLEAVGKKLVGQSRQVGNLMIKRLILNSSGAGAYLLWPSGAKKLVARYEKAGAGLADAFMNETPSFLVWQLDPAVIIQMCMLPYYGMPEMNLGVSQIAREKNTSPTPPNFGVYVRMRWRRVKGEIQKGIRRLGVLLGHRRQFISYLDRHRT